MILARGILMVGKFIVLIDHQLYIFLKGSNREVINKGTLQRTKHQFWDHRRDQSILKDSYIEDYQY